MRFLGDMQMPCRWASLFIGALLGNLEGVRVPGLLREMNSISEYLCEPGGHSGLSLSEALTSLIHIQGVPGGMCQTSGGCSLC